MVEASGRSVLVTGASTGIGRACALRLAALGHEVFAGIRREADGDSLRAEAKGELTPLSLDVTDEGEIDQARKTIESRVGSRGLDGLVNNAGVALGGPLEYLPVDVWRTQLEVNVVGQVAVTQAMLPLVRVATGRVVFIGSIGGRVGTPIMGPYNASKFALEGIAESFREEMRPWGIRVVLVEPGAIKTDIWGKGRSQADELEARLPDEAKELYAPLIVGIRKLIDRQDRMAIRPDRVAKVVERALFSPNPKHRYLVGPDARILAALSRTLPDRAKDAVGRRLTGLNVPRQPGPDAP